MRSPVRLPVRPCGRARASIYPSRLLKKVMETYREYLKGRHWRRLRMRLRRAVRCCEICGGPLWMVPPSGGEVVDAWECHHWTYRNVPKEREVDLSILCIPCHRDVHAYWDGQDVNLMRRSTYIAWSSAAARKVRQIGGRMTGGVWHQVKHPIRVEDFVARVAECMVRCGESQ